VDPSRQEGKARDEGSHLLAVAVDLSEREGIGADAGIEEFDLEGALGNGPRLPDQLIEPLLPHAAPPFRIDIETMVGTRRRAVDSDPEANRPA
jgi:hypothetical protein